MNNRDNYKNTFSAIRPSDETVERVLNMSKSKKRIKPMALVALAVSIVLIVTATFGAGTLSAKINPIENPTDNTFTITAFAMDNDGNKTELVELKDDAITQTGTRIYLQEDDISTGSPYSVHCSSDNGFITNAENIDTITYTCQHGIFDYQTLIHCNYEVTVNSDDYDPEYPYASSITIKYTDNEEMLEVFYEPEEAIDTLLKTLDTDYSKLIGDTITVSVKFKDGTSAEKTIKTSFTKDGYMNMQYV